jgi:O-antigen/teichoic acid export membrane protein
MMIVLLIAFGRGAQFVLALAMMRVMTTLLPPSEIGRMSLFVSATAFFALFMINPVGMFINRRLHAWEEQGAVKRHLDYFWAYLLVVAVLASSVLTLLNILGVIDLQTSMAWLWGLVGGTLLINTANQTVIPSLNLLGFRGRFIGMTLATLASGFLVAVALVLRFQPRAEYWLLGLLVGQLLFACIGGKMFFDRLANPKTASAGRPTRAHVAVLFAFAWPVSIAVGMNWAQAQSYRFFMEHFLGLATLGLFVAGYGISAGLISGFESLLTTYFQPIFYKRVSGGDRIEQGNAWTSYAGAILPSILLVGFFVAAAAPELTRLLLGADYQDSSKFVVWGAIAESARVATGVYAMVAHARMKTRLLLLPNAVGVIASLSIMLWLIPKYGADGVGMALALAGVAGCFAAIFVARAELVTTLPKKVLIQCAVAGAILTVVGTVARKVIHGDGMLVTFSQLCFFGILFISAQYWILRNFFKIKE